jgi:hypothetical protein
MIDINALLQALDRKEISQRIQRASFVIRTCAQAICPAFMIYVLQKRLKRPAEIHFTDFTITL